jgi:hypothetical protein
VQHHGVRPDLAGELLDQARLPDSGLAQHGQEVTLSILDDAFECVQKRSELLLAVDQRRVESTRATGGMWTDFDECEPA